MHGEVACFEAIAYAEVGSKECALFDYAQDNLQAKACSLKQTLRIRYCAESGRFAEFSYLKIGRARVRPTPASLQNLLQRLNIQGRRKE